MAVRWSFQALNAGFGAPTPAFSTRTDCLYVFATDESRDSGLWYIRQPSSNNDNLSAWNSLGNPATTKVIGPPGYCENDGLIQVFAVGADGALWSIQQIQVIQPGPHLEWSGWSSYGKPGVSIGDRPTASPGFDGRNELFIVGADGSLYHIWQTAFLNGWSNWFSHGNPGHPIFDHPQIAYPADGRLMVFVSNQDGVHYLRQTAQSNGWSNWVSLGKPAGGGPQSAPAVFAQQNNLLHLFVTAADGSLWNIHQNSADYWSYWSSFGQP